MRAATRSEASAALVSLVVETVADLEFDVGAERIFGAAGALAFTFERDLVVVRLRHAKAALALVRREALLAFVDVALDDVVAGAAGDPGYTGVDERGDVRALRVEEV